MDKFGLFWASLLLAYGFYNAFLRKDPLRTKKQTWILRSVWVFITGLCVLVLCSSKILNNPIFNQILQPFSSAWAVPIFIGAIILVAIFIVIKLARDSIVPVTSLDWNRGLFLLVFAIEAFGSRFFYHRTYTALPDFLVIVLFLALLFLMAFVLVWFPQFKPTYKNGELVFGINAYANLTPLSNTIVGWLVVLFVIPVVMWISFQ